MNAHPSRRVALLCALAGLASAGALGAEAGGDAKMLNPEAIEWGAAPPVLPKGAKLAVLHGDPSKPGPYTMRLSAPAGYKIAPHTHTQAEQLTVVTGALYLGMGDKADASKAHPLKAGGFHYLPGGTPHYVFTKAPTVIQVDGQGPFDMVYLDPKDNPDTGAKP